LTVQMGLTLSALLFVGTHFLLSHPLRGPLVRAVGERPFRGIYALVALLTFGAMIYFYRRCGPEPPLWDAGDAGWIAGTLLMWLASILLIGSFFGNPALPGVLARSQARPKGVFAITRHPMMWAFALWAAVHLMLIAATKAMVFDGAIIILALLGAAAQDRKKARLMGEDWHDWTAQTAFIPFTRGVANPGAVALIGGTLFFFLASWLHPIHAGFWRWIG
jgi:uncharacterized membrane protein